MEAKCLTLASDQNIHGPLCEKSEIRITCNSPDIKDAFFLSHNGLGDNITCIGAVLFLLKYYKTIYFLCKDYNERNVKLLFHNKSVITVSINSGREFDHCKEIIDSVDKNKNDVFISGYHKTYLSSHITSEALLNYTKANKYNLKYDFIREFYNDILLDTCIYVHYFDIKTEESLSLYLDIADYKIIFLHTQASNKTIDLNNIIEIFINKENYIVICPNKNIYNKTDLYYELANKYVMLKVADYIDIIKNAEEIHVIDSCFACMVYPLLLAKKLSSSKTIIYDR
jgi:hypothetical protein